LRVFIKEKFNESTFFTYQLRVAQFKLLDKGTETPVDIFQNWQRKLDETPPVNNLVFVLLDSYILDYSTQKHSKKNVAAAALAVSRKLIHRDAVQQWTLQLETITSLRIIEFKTVYDEMFYVAYLLFKDPPDNTISQGIITVPPDNEIINALGPIIG
jgi:hypothetical protein